MKDKLVIVIVLLVVFVMALIVGIQQHQINSLDQQVEILGFEADVASAYMRDQNSINAKLVEKIVLLEQTHEVFKVQ